MLAVRLRLRTRGVIVTAVCFAAFAMGGSVFGQSTTKKPAKPATSTVPKKVAQATEPPPLPAAPRTAQRMEESPGPRESPAPARDPNRKVMQIASLSAEEVQAKQSTALRKSMTVYVPKLINERQNVTRTIMAPVTSHELRPVWSPGQGKWISYRPTGQTIWAPRTEVVTMDVPVWKYVAETRYVEEPIVRQNFYAPIQTAPDAWAWKQPSPYGAGAQPIIPPYQPPHRPVLTFLQNRPLVGRLFGGGRPVFPPAPAPVGPTTVNYQQVSLYQPNYSGVTGAPGASGNGIPSFTAPPLPTAGAAGTFGGVRSYE